jgi:hypothetical protein
MKHEVIPTPMSGKLNHAVQPSVKTGSRILRKTRRETAGEPRIDSQWPVGVGLRPGRETPWSSHSESESYNDSLSLSNSTEEPSHRAQRSAKGKHTPQTAVPDDAKNTYKKKYKTEICKNFACQGYCRWGDACCYAHGQEELRSKTHLNSNYKSKICKHYHKQGGCPYGLR